MLCPGTRRQHCWRRRWSSHNCGSNENHSSARAPAHQAGPRTKPTKRLSWCGGQPAKTQRSVWSLESSITTSKPTALSAPEKSKTSVRLSAIEWRTSDLYYVYSVGAPTAGMAFCISKTFYQVQYRQDKSRRRSYYSHSEVHGMRIRHQELSRPLDHSCAMA